MPFMLKIQWDLKDGREADFRTNQEALCKVMADDHPGVICYHADYPSAGVSQWAKARSRPELIASKRSRNARLTGPGAGTGMSSRYSRVSIPPCPVR